MPASDDNRDVRFWVVQLFNKLNSLINPGNQVNVHVASSVPIETSGDARATIVQPIDANGNVRVNVVQQSCTTASTIKIYDEVTGTGKGLNFYVGQPVITNQDYLYAISEGDIPGHTLFRKLCASDSIGTTEVPVWAPATAYVFPSIAGQQMELYSSNANDTALGSGIRTVELTYLDTSYVERTEIVTLQGNTAVPTVATNIVRVNRLRANTAGSIQGVAAGNIDCRALADTPIYSRIPTGKTRARAGVYTVPAGKWLHITSILCSGGTGTGARFITFNLRATWDEVMGQSTSVFLPNAEIAVEDGGLLRTFEVPIVLGPQADLMLMALSDGANTICRAAIRGWIE